MKNASEEWREHGACVRASIDLADFVLQVSRKSRRFRAGKPSVNDSLLPLFAGRLRKPANEPARILGGVRQWV